jgi:hypothetical protein
MSVMTAVLGAGSPPAQAAALHRPEAFTPSTIAQDVAMHGGGTVSADAAELRGVATVSTADAWAVGYYTPSSGGGTLPLMVHWNGKTWVQVQCPTPSGATVTQLDAVSADSAKDIWAAGSYQTQAPGQLTLILHWNGKTCSLKKSPTPTNTYVNLTAVSAVSPTNAWTVGQLETSSSPEAMLILHWNGKTWSRVKATGSGSWQLMSGVDAVSPSDIWVSGMDGNASSTAIRPLFLQGNGTTWTKRKVPAPTGLADMWAVSANSPTDGWAVGDGEASGGAVTVPLSWHWNGTAWTKVTTPAPSGSTGELNGVSAFSATRAWAVGDFQDSAAHLNPLIEQCGVKTCKQVTSPTPNPDFTSMQGVSADSATDAWAVGYYLNSAATGDLPLTLHWNGAAWKITPVTISG